MIILNTYLYLCSATTGIIGFNYMDSSYDMYADKSYECVEYNGRLEFNNGEWEPIKKS